MGTVDGRGGVPICSAIPGTNNGNTAIPSPIQNYTGHVLIMATLPAATATQNGSIRFPPPPLPHEMFPYFLLIYNSTINMRYATHIQCKGLLSLKLFTPGRKLKMSNAFAFSR